MRPPEYRIAKSLMGEYPSLTDFEALQIAVGIRQNELLEKPTSIIEALEGIKDTVKDVAEILEEKFPQ